MRKLGVLLLALLAVSFSLLADARSPRGGAGVPGLPSVAGLHIVGNRILNGLGQYVQLRGVDQDGTEYMCLDGTVGDIFDPTSGAPNAQTAPGASTLSALQSWGVNIVRLPINESCWLGINGATTGGTTYQTAITNYVSYLTSNNIAVIIDLQWVGPGTQLAQDWCGGQFAPLPDLDHAPTLWTSVANAFKSNSSVIFDLYNEPWPENNADTVAAWTALKLGQTTGGAQYVVDNTNSSCATAYNAVGTQALVTAIRGTGSTNIIDAPGIQFTDTLTSWVAFKPTDTLNPPQIAIGWHSYAGQSCSNMTCWSTTVATAMANAPLMTEELGENDCQGIYVDPLMSWLDSVGGNYMAWSWNTYDCSSFPAVISDTSGTPTGFGVEVRNHLLALAGMPIPPTPPETFFSTTYPFGIAVGKSANYTASDGTVYYQDPYVQAGSGTFTVAPGLQENMQFFQPFTTADTITGTSDPTLYQTGRQGVFGNWLINVPNGTYYVTLGMAFNSTYNVSGTTVTDPWGQDQTIQGNKVGTCIWSSFSGSNPFMGTACPASAVFVPSVDVAYTVTYTISVFNGVLNIEPAASFGGGRTTILNSIKVCTALPC